MSSEEETRAAAQERRWLANPWIRYPVLFLGVPYVVLGIIFFFLQDSLLFYPQFTTLADADILRAVKINGAEELHVTVASDVTLHGFFCPGVGEGPRPTLLYFGGNSEKVGLETGDHDDLRKAGWNVVLIEYRGYGRSQGKPSAAALLADSLVVFDAIAARDDVDPARIVTWGRSLGSGVAAYVAAKRKALGVVLVSPYARLSEVAAHHFPWLPVRLMFRNEIDTMEFASSITAPALLLHGDADTVIPHSQSVRLRGSWRPQPELVTMAGRDHESVDLDPAFLPAVQRFLEGLR